MVSGVQRGSAFSPRGEGARRADEGAVRQTPFYPSHTLRMFVAGLLTPLIRPLAASLHSADCVHLLPAGEKGKCKGGTS
jgi:hypothetical protein